MFWKYCSAAERQVLARSHSTRMVILMKWGWRGRGREQPRSHRKAAKFQFRSIKWLKQPWLNESRMSKNVSKHLLTKHGRFSNFFFYFNCPITTMCKKAQIMFPRIAKFLSRLVQFPSKKRKCNFCSKFSSFLNPFNCQLWCSNL